ncbi:MAG: amino acid--tRNA ligase-related protein, partial [Thermoplasmata archaeon]
LPPNTGVGFGVDRLLMGLLGIPSIKEIILFPLIRSRSFSDPIGVIPAAGG